MPSSSIYLWEGRFLLYWHRLKKEVERRLTSAVWVIWMPAIQWVAPHLTPALSLQLHALRLFPCHLQVMQSDYHLLSFHCSSSCGGFEHTGRIEPIHLLISDPDCFSVLCPARFPRTVKPCEKIDSQLLITHLSLPAATSAEHWAQSDYRSSFTWISVAVITLLGKHREGQTSFVVCFLSPCSTVILVRIAAEAERKTV